MSNTKAEISTVPFAEPSYLRGLPSPYFQPTHLAFQRRCRAWFAEHFLPHALEWETAGTVPSHVWHTFNAANMLVPNLNSPLPVSWLHRLNIRDILGVPVQEWDYLHTAIWVDERARTGISGPGSSLSPGFAYGIPPILNFGSDALKEKFLPDLLTGKARTCIAITEPQAGSDVAGIQTTAVKSSDGKKYVINGEKKWITNGIWADYAPMAVRTGGLGPQGISLIVVPLKDYPGVKMRRLQVMGQQAGGTTYIELDDVRVPVENLVGKEGEGMKYIMTNFNHERMLISIGVTRQARVALSTAVEYAMKREAFGKTLMDQPVVRHRIAKAGAELETLQALIFEFVYQLNHLTKAEADDKLGGPTALLKAKAGMVLNECAQTAVLIFGGNGYTRTGQGELVEKIYRDVMGARIPGGSEDVMLDLAIRQLVKNFQKEAGRVGSKL
ncbi:hypothetical protein LTR99_003078 [Exophiala xenobiotica]|uniref:Acyl-CoA dehydrogenase n=1 Tax=Vermiconidia calcicola TaxID=1690605 RepID=A0AAV9QBB3_9PEZI|nr:hypothetical protein LTR41_001664 [Exophiala xenobiotica]KAK5538745.1 hypothetical protein LTR25_004288 [Vermiconidia calcicola]KAK5547766.1 hypothetical protein LTR23_002014 [Chaetothyriales sp. CCFEE 6169]KAK5221897.1 hypothetical protein LTR72_006153 [Exophiala xenobiotica]KAK5235789.1 hypothetical protein LTR47_003263 [Exophiala xenobiotica]